MNAPLPKGGVLLPRDGSMTVAISPQEIEYFLGGRLALFRLWRKAVLQKGEQSFGNPVTMTGVEIARGPLLKETVFYMTVGFREVVPTTAPAIYARAEQRPASLKNIR